MRVVMQRPIPNTLVLVSSGYRMISGPRMEVIECNDFPDSKVKRFFARLMLRSIGWEILSEDFSPSNNTEKIARSPGFRISKGPQRRVPVNELIEKLRRLGSWSTVKGPYDEMMLQVANDLETAQAEIIRKDAEIQRLGKEIKRGFVEGWERRSGRTTSSNLECEEDWQQSEVKERIGWTYDDSINNWNASEAKKRLEQA